MIKFSIANSSASDRNNPIKYIFWILIFLYMFKLAYFIVQLLFFSAFSLNRKLTKKSA